MAMMLPESTLLLALLCFAIVKCGASTDVTALPIATDAHSNNSTLLEVHVRLHNDLRMQRALLTNAPTKAVAMPAERASLQSNNFIVEFANILWSTANVEEWQQALQILTELAANTPNQTVKYLTYEVLWRKLQETQLRHNPAIVLTLYKELQRTMHSISSTNNDTTALVEFTALQAQMRAYVIERSAQLLQAPLYATHSYDNNTNLKCTQFPAIERLLVELNQLPDDVYNDTLNVVFDAAEQLQTTINITKALLCWGGSVPQRLRASIKYQQRLLKHNVSLETVDLLQQNIEELVRHADLGQIPADLLLRINVYLPRSLRALRESSAICIRNATSWSNYLYECAQTFLMCTHEGANQYRASYRVERLLGHKFVFRSNYWSARYIKLEESGHNATLPALIKNVYSDLRASVWQAVFVGDLVALLDVEMRFYLCGGNPAMWSSSEHHAYTRRAQDFHRYRQECLWYIEDCSGAM